MARHPAVRAPPGAARSAQLPATHGSVVHCRTGPAGGPVRPLLGGRRAGPHTPPLWWASGSRAGSASRPASSSRQCTWMSTSFLGKWCWGPCKTVCEAIPSQTAKCRRKQSPRLSRRPLDADTLPCAVCFQMFQEDNETKPSAPRLGILNPQPYCAQLSGHFSRTPTHPRPCPFVRPGSAPS